MVSATKASFQGESKFEIMNQPQMDISTPQDLTQQGVEVLSNFVDSTTFYSISLI